MKVVHKKSYIDPKTGEEVLITAADRIKTAKTIGLGGIGLLTIVFLMFGWEFFQNSKTIRVSGIVLSVGVSNSVTQQSGGRTSKTHSYSHTFSYVDRDGVEQVGSTGEPDRDAFFAQGDVVAIGYFADNPSQVRIRSWFRRWKIQLALVGLGLFLLWFSRASVKSIEDAPEAG